jgi:hypothetical protein
MAHQDAPILFDADNSSGSSMLATQDEMRRITSVIAKPDRSGSA